MDATKKHALAADNFRRKDFRLPLLLNFSAVRRFCILKERIKRLVSPKIFKKEHRNFQEAKTYHHQ